MQSEIAESAEIFKSCRFVIFLYQSLKVTALIRQITNKECLRGNATRISQYLSILYHVTSVVIFQVKSSSYSTLCFFVHRELVSTLLKNNPAFYLAIIQCFLNFLQIPRIHRTGRIRGIGRNF